MTAPERPPSFFDRLTGEDVPEPAARREPGFLLDDLARDAALWPEWLIDDDSQRVVVLSVVEHVSEQKLVVSFSLGRPLGTVTATPDASGYLRIVVDVGGTEFLTAYVERIWEEYELWPPGAKAAMGEESPGRLGKHRSWVSLSTVGWPALSAITDESWLNLRQLER